MQFITTDTPAFMNTVEKKLFYGCFFFPLTPKHVLLIKHKTYNEELLCEYVETNVETARKINGIILKNAGSIAITSKEKIRTLVQF